MLLNGFALWLSCLGVIIHNFYLRSGPLKAENEMRILVQGIIKSTHFGKKPVASESRIEEEQFSKNVLSNKNQASTASLREL